jgi:spore coat polysaccharide biosynthesis predicted glycosyltransferase SpsG
MDKNPLILIVCTASSFVGLGHLTRMLSLSDSLKKQGVTNTKFVIVGERLDWSGLKNTHHKFVDENINLKDEIINETSIASPRIVIFDIHPKFISPEFDNLLIELALRKIYLVGIDSLVHYAGRLDLLWIPSFFRPTVFKSFLPASVKYGWDTYLLRKRLNTKKWVKGDNILVLTGGSDSLGLGKSMPALLNNVLPAESQIHWVQGPYSLPPDLPELTKLRWIVYNKLESLDSLITKCNYALTVFGVSFYELLQYGIPSVVFSPYGSKDYDELEALRKENVAIVSIDIHDAISKISLLINDSKFAQKLSTNSLSKMEVNGSDNLAGILISRLETTTNDFSCN